jgi:Tfp pilus assembly protein PilF
MKMKSWLLGIGLLLTNLAFGQTVQEGLHLMERHQSSKAKVIFENLVAAQPTLGENHFYLGYYYLNQRDWENARKSFEAGKAAEPKNSYLNQVGLASILVGQNKVNDAKVEFDRILAETKNKNFDVMYRIAEAYTMYFILGKDDAFNASNNDPGEAIRLIDLIQEKTFKNPTLFLADYYVVKGDAFRIKNDGGNAVTAYENAVAKFVENKDRKAIKAKIRIASVFHGGKNYNQAQRRYKEAVEEDSTYAPALLKYGEFLTVGRQYKPSARYFKKYLENSDFNPEVKLSAARTLFLAKDNAAAMKLIEEVEASGLKNDDLFRMKGYGNIEMGNFQVGVDNLEELMRKGIKPYPTDDFYIGRGYQGLNNDSLALKYYEKAAPSDTVRNIYTFIREIHFKVKNYKDASKASLNSIQWKASRNETISSNDYFTVGRDIYLYAKYGVNSTDTLGKQSFALKADSLIAKAIEINSKWPVYYYFRAQTNNVLDVTRTKFLGAPFYEQFISAVETQRTEKTSYKEDKNQLYEAYRLLWGYYSTLKNDAKATEMAKKALEVKPDAPDINDIKTYLSPTPAGAAPVAPKK